MKTNNTLFIIMKKNYIYIFFIIIFILLCIYILINKNNNETFSLFYKNQFNSKIYFLDINEASYVLKNDDDDYFKGFYKLDYISRNINNIQDYYSIIDKSVDNFSIDEKIKLNKAIQMANDRIKNIYFEWFDGKKCLDIPWNLICVKGKLYENGLSHTRSNFIIISKKNIDTYSMDKLTKTLIHEKVHIYQKIYKEDSEKYLKENNFKRYKYREESDNIRANPDIDKWIYKDASGNIYSAKYVNNNPESIESIEYKPYNSQSYEHPYEKMAIYIENYI